jgi:ribonuclease Z
MAEKIKISFLGTGSAIPTKRRNHPSMLLQYKEENILIDCGEGTQRQFRIAGLNPCKLTRLLITHWHGDHVLGIPGLLQTLMLNNYNKTLHIYGPKGTKEFMQKFAELFVAKGNYFRLNVQEIESGKFFESEDFFLEAEKMDHDTQNLAYSLNIKEQIRLDKKKLQKLKLPSGPLIGELKHGKTIDFKGKKISGKDLIYREEQRKISVILDTRENSKAAIFAKNSDILISEATYSKSETELAKEYAHLTSEQAANIAKQAKAKKLILTHISQRYENPKLLLEEARKIFKNTEVAEDFLQIEL